MAIMLGLGAYKCTACGKIFTWDDNSSWYGSYKDLEEKGVAGIDVYCSDDCRPDKGATPCADKVKRKNYEIS